MKPSPLALKMLAKALPEVGVEEKPKGSNRGPRVDDYQRATDLKPEDWGPWCASFVCFCMREAMTGGSYTFKRMTTAAVRYIRAWSLRQDNSTKTIDAPGRNILPGDILIYTFSHTGICKTAPGPNGNFTAVEGNTNDDGGREGYKVLLQSRHYSRVKTVIRLTV